MSIAAIERRDVVAQRAAPVDLQTARHVAERQAFGVLASQRGHARRRRIGRDQRGQHGQHLVDVDKRALHREGPVAPLDAGDVPDPFSEVAPELRARRSTSKVSPASAPSRSSRSCLPPPTTTTLSKTISPTEPMVKPDDAGAGAAPLVAGSGPAPTARLDRAEPERARAAALQARRSTASASVSLPFRTRTTASSTRLENRPRTPAPTTTSSAVSRCTPSTATCVSVTPARGNSCACADPTVTREPSQSLACRSIGALQHLRRQQHANSQRGQRPAARRAAPRRRSAIDRFERVTSACYRTTQEGMLESPDADTATGALGSRHHGHRLWRVGHRRRRLGVRLGTAGRRRFGRDDSARDRPRHQLGGHGRGVRARPFRAGRRACAGGDPGGTPAVRLHEVEPGVGRAPQGLAQPACRFDPARGRRQPATPWRRGHRPLSDSLAALGKLAGRMGPGPDRRRLAGHGRPAEGREGPLHRRVQFLARGPGPRRGRRARDEPAAALLPAPPRRRGRSVSVVSRARHRRDRLLADAVGPAHRHDDARTAGGACPRTTGGGRASSSRSRT